MLEAVLGEEAEGRRLDVGVAGGLWPAHAASHAAHLCMLASFHFCHQCSYCAAMDTAAIDTDRSTHAPAARRPVADRRGPIWEDQPAEDVTADDLAAEDLIEEVSIDGMCGVY